jgi:hypothetical protein
MSPEPPVTVAELVRRLLTWLHRLMPDGPRLDRLTADLETRFGDVTTEVTADDCRAVERCAWAYSRHLLLPFDPDGTAAADEVSRGWPAPDPDVLRARAGGLTRVERLDGGACLITVDSLEAVTYAQPFVDAAFALARGSSRIILDLRANGGGDPATLAAIAGWLLGDEPQHLSDVAYRDRRRQWWTPARPAGTALGQDATVLVSARTFSSAEALAYHLQARGRVTVVGETTPGAADHITPVQLTPTVLGLLPEAVVVDAVTGTNWEGRGVVPDVPCPAGDAVETALAQEPGGTRP